MNSHITAFKILLIGILMLLFASCEEYDENACPACPVITDINPSTGKAYETITITGRNFSGFNTAFDKATIGGIDLIPIETQSYTDQQMYFMIPPELGNGNTAPMPVRVKIGNLTSDDTPGISSFNFLYAYPVIDQLEPAYGQVGDLIKIKGNHFDTIPANNIVRINGIRAQVENASETELQIRIPEGVSTAPVQLSLFGYNITGPEFSFNTVMVDSINPRIGRKGEMITIMGRFFGKEPSDNKVFFNELQAEVVAVSDTTLKVTVPDGSTSGKIKVEVNGRTASVQPDFTYAKVMILQLEPNNGRAGDIITIHGKYFAAEAEDNEVKFGNLSAEVTEAGDNFLKVKIPQDAESGKVLVSADGFSSEKALDFTYNKVKITELLPNNGRRGENIKIKGSYFGQNPADNKVFFGEVEATVIQASESELTVTIPDNADDCQVRVEADSRTSDESLPFTYDKVVVTALEPASARFGDTLRITGQYFGTSLTTNKVMINQQELVVVEVKENSLKVLVPKGIGSGNVLVEADNRPASNQPTFTYLYTPILYNFVSVERPDNHYRLGNKLYVPTAYNKIVAVDLNAKTVAPFAGSGEIGYLDGNPLSAKFLYVSGISTDKNGNIYVADMLNNSIRKISSNTVSTLAGSVNGIAGLQNSTFSSSVRFDGPKDIVFDGEGGFYISDVGNKAIRYTTLSGTTTTVLTNIYANGLCFDGNDLYISGFDHKIYRYDPDGEGLTVLAGSGQGRVNGKATEASFNTPTDLLYKADENCLYIVDSGNNQIRRLSLNSLQVSTFVGTGAKGNANGKFGEFNNPVSISLDPEGSMYVSDHDNHMIRKIAME